MKKIRFIRTCSTSHGHTEAGAVLELSDDEADQLVACRRAVAAGQIIEVREPVVENRDPVVVKPKRFKV